MSEVIRHLKGRNSEKIPEEKKERMEKTAERMIEVRCTDCKNLRNEIEKRLITLAEEKKKAFLVLEQLKNQQNEIGKQIIKLQGAEENLKNLLENKNETN
jgi:hypothetical protein